MRAPQAAAGFACRRSYVGKQETSVDSVRAVCDCKNRDERNPVLALRDGPLDFAKHWGALTWIAFLVLSLVTGGVWLVLVGPHTRDFDRAGEAAGMPFRNPEQ